MRLIDWLTCSLADAYPWIQVLIIENSLRCVLSWTVEEAGYWAYHAARDYAERYDPHYGTGLIPESAPMVKAIVGFWCEYNGVEI